MLVLVKANAYGHGAVEFASIMEKAGADYLAVAFDVHAPTFRHEMYEAYKGTRKAMPEELREQVPLIKEVLTAMKVAIVTMEGYEADDLLGTIAGMAEKKGIDATILSGDRDLLQLASDHVLIRIPKTKGGKTVAYLLMQQHRAHPQKCEKQWDGQSQGIEPVETPDQYGQHIQKQDHHAAIQYDCQIG